MGTRSDYYVGRGETAEWLGSRAWDGYPSGISDAIKSAKTEEEFREAIEASFSEEEDATTPEQGWPWPWGDSRTTDYAYAFDDGQVWASCFGREWFKADEPEPDVEDGPKVAVFPNMKHIQNVTFGPRSGVIVISTKPKDQV